ncbi:MAG TPA: peroxiredoxin [Streptosporangiaceae bacterium]|nr:peroxiredoxin [Streptosporangiaceae bacterium]
MAKTPEIGAVPPDFTLPGVQLTGSEVSKSEYTLSQHHGQPLVLAFYPGDNTTVCTRQLCSYTSGLESFTDFGAQVWAISPQGLASHEQFARRYGLAFPLLADEGLVVSRRYGIAMGGVGLRRSVFVVDADGVLRWKHVTLVGLTFPSASTISAQLAALTEAR